jgi:hypothetical protein
VEILQPHFDKIFNGESRPIDMEKALGMAKQRPTHQELDRPISMSELNEYIAGASNKKAPGESQIPAEALKALSHDTRVMLLLGLLQDFFDGRTDPEEWHMSILKVLHKKGDLHNPTNWRGICLKDMTVRIMSAILNARLLKLIDKYGVETQYGSQPHHGTLDGLAILRTALETRRYHGQGTWALFVDLVKAFDTADHQLLFGLLRKYGAPEKIVRAVETLYTNVSVKIQVGKEKRQIPYTIGVQQGNNMAPVLFVFLMQAFAETLVQK